MFISLFNKFGLLVYFCSITVGLLLDNDVHEEYECFLNEWIVKVVNESELYKIIQDGFELKDKIPQFENLFLLTNPNISYKSNSHCSNTTQKLLKHTNVHWTQQQVLIKRHKRSSNFDDSLWPRQWYVNDDNSSNESSIHLSLNVKAVWGMGFTGKGIVLSVVDDGLEWNNTDIYANYDELASYDFNDNDPDPFPRYDSINTNEHGTKCAGVIAMNANNQFCAVGIAYNSKVGGMRILDGSITDLIEAKALSFNNDHIDIISASWGPLDNGKTVGGPGNLTEMALRKGFTLGRKGKGVVYVWAGGNGGRLNDDCNCDGFVNSVYTIAINGLKQDGTFPRYGESCAAIMGAFFSGSDSTGIITTGLHNTCNTDFSGTSSVAPIAAGVFALVLEANYNITARDIQHLVAWTSAYEPLANDSDWKTNAAGFKFNNKFGFGLLNAKALVDAALNWTNVPDKRVCEIYPNNFKPLHLTWNNQTELIIESNSCENSSDHINYLEKIQLFSTIEYKKRGAIKIDIISPSGTETNLLKPRPLDLKKRFDDWPFMSVSTWGENPFGTWTIKIKDKTDDAGNFGMLENIKLVLHGTYEKPDYMKNGPKIYI